MTKKEEDFALAMAIDQLQDLAKRYVSNQIAYADFRQVFVQRFLSAPNASGPAIDLCNRIEALCCDAELGVLPEPKLKVRLSEETHQLIAAAGPEWSHVRWFGTSWHAPICNPRFEIPTPIGALCFFCGSAITDSDRGISMASLPPERVIAHLRCILRSVGVDIH